jgi:hypothetical protein
MLSFPFWMNNILMIHILPAKDNPLLILVHISLFFPPILQLAPIVFSLFLQRLFLACQLLKDLHVCFPASPWHK